MTDNLSHNLLEILACPKCKSDLFYDIKNRELICNHCHVSYPFKNDTANMTIGEDKKKK